MPWYDGDGIAGSDGSRVLYSTYLPDTVASTSAIAVDALECLHRGEIHLGHALAVKLSADGGTFSTIRLGGSGAGRRARLSPTRPATSASRGRLRRRISCFVGRAAEPAQGVQNLFVAGFDPSGRVEFATYLGGSGTEIRPRCKPTRQVTCMSQAKTSSLDFPPPAAALSRTPLCRCGTTRRGFAQAQCRMAGAFLVHLRDERGSSAFQGVTSCT